MRGKRNPVKEKNNNHLRGNFNHKYIQKVELKK